MNKKHNGTYFLDLADNGYWLIKSEAGYRECIGVGDEGKKAALEKIERLNKGGGKMSKLNKKDLLEWLENAFKVWIVPEAGDPDELILHESAEQAYQQIEKLIQGKPEITEKFVEKWALLFVGIKSFKAFEESREAAKEIVLEMLKEAGVEVVEK